ncbi:MAG: DUF2341 domain-containing protein [candidate division WOR-3 bacterium]
MWLSNWQYRRPITINNTNNSNNLSDYQVLITIDTASLISVGKMKNDCGDVRFCDSDGTTLLDYWIESGINTSSTKIWVKVPSIPASSTKTIYFYYGNPSASSASNGNNTFLFFDDFEGTTLDTTKWNWINFGGSYSVSNSILTITDSGGGNDNSGIMSVSYKPPADTIIETLGKSRNIGVYKEIYWIALQDVNSTNIYNALNSHFLFLSGGSSIRHQSRYGGSWGTEDVVYSAYSPNTWRIGKVVLRANSQDWYLLTPDRTVEGSLLNNTDLPQNFARTYYVGLQTREETNDFDWILVRKYTSPEPTTSVGAEETLVMSRARRRLLISKQVAN